MEIKKVLILSAPLGEGHHAAAKALKEAFALKYPQIQVEFVDVFDFTFKVFKKTVSWSFVFINSKMPFIYKQLYLHCNEYLQQKILNQISYSIIHKKKFTDFIKELKPDFIFSTNPLPMHLISLTKKKHIIDILSANVCTDFGFHSLWLNADVNYYFTANEEIKKSLIAKGVAQNSIRVFGIPINPKFNGVKNKEKVTSELGFDKNKPVLLIVGGKVKYHKLLKIIEGLRQKNNSLQFIVITGRDGHLKKKLDNLPIKNDPKIRVFGFVNNLEEYMDVADLILTKAGGLTVAECMAMELPMIVEEIIPGQEEDNVDYLVLNNAGVRVNSARETIKVIADLFSEPAKIRAMEENCKKIKKPDSAMEIADFIVSELRTKN